jgi:uncharacterized protein YqjF (DUF2071 family)
VFVAARPHVLDVADDDAPLLTAVWRHLAFFNYEVDPALLMRRVPPGTELDTWHGRALVSLIGLRFLDLAVLGLRVPGHRAFDQINFRFYVRRPLGEGEWRRGVVFLKEIVPRRLIATVARLRYREPYARRATRHSLEPGAPLARDTFTVRYEWKQQGRWQGFSGHASGQAAVFAPGSVEDFITERYWGYNGRPGRPTTEFGIRHPSWSVWPLRDPRLAADVAATLGPAWVEPLSRRPHSAFLADGSPVAVSLPHAIADEDVPGAAA